MGNGQDNAPSLSSAFANKVTPLAYQDQSGLLGSVRYRRVGSQHPEGYQVLALVRAQHLG